MVPPDNVLGFLKDLPVRKLPGVGPKTEETLHKLGIKTCGEIRDIKPEKLRAHFGKWGPHLLEMANGIDEREVVPHWEPTQLSTEETFAKDILKPDWLKEKLEELSRQVFSELEEKGKTGRTIVLKVKYHDFEQITRSRTLPAPPEDWRMISETVTDLLLSKTLAGKKAVRLLGVGVSGLRKNIPGGSPAPFQKDLFDVR